ncbi:MAG TPA: hypothetical protein VKD90_13870 [Gemmataceae bacterium]|nr:hypothetical protein [Gemmataceae bacterium]
MLFAQADGLPDAIRDNWVYAAIGAGLLIALVVLYRIATSRKKPPPDLERGLREDLATYPLPPAAAGPRRLSVNGVPVRVRLVVVAPIGKQQTAILPDEVRALLDDVVRGLGGFVPTDKPRIRVWPPQLSVAGFAPTFHRLVVSPDRDRPTSRWVKLAGPARTGQRPILLGLALLADEPCKMGDLHVETTEWHEVLEVAR